jgi:uncharacterized membrane protein
VAGLRSLPLGVLAIIGLLLLATLGGLVALWPDEGGGPKLDESLRAPTYDAEVVALEATPCQTPEARGCKRIRAKLLAGPDEGKTTGFASGESTSDPDFAVGDRVRLARNEIPEGSPPGIDQYTFSDYDRRGPMLWLLAGFAAIVVLFGRLRGVMSLIGLGISIAVIATFIVPAILEGKSPLGVALVGSSAVMFATMFLAHGVGPKSVAAALGTTTALLLTAGLAIAFTELANITGFSSEEATLLQGVAGDLSLEGLVLAGIVIAALGVLDDLTISQASSVMALRRANPAHGVRDLYRGAVAIGRDHVAATVNTLVLAYVGASLPVLLVFSIGGIPFADAINREAVSQQVVGTLVGSIGLIAAVPLTTAIAATLATRGGIEVAAADAEHGHVH